MEYPGWSSISPNVQVWHTSTAPLNSRIPVGMYTYRRPYLATDHPIGVEASGISISLAFTRSPALLPLSSTLRRVRYPRHVEQIPVVECCRAGRRDIAG